MADLVSLTDVAFALGLLTTIFGFYARFIRPSVVSTLTWRKDMESQVREQRKDFESKTRELELRIERHDKTDGELLAGMNSLRKAMSDIRTAIAVLEERSKAWGTRGA